SSSDGATSDDESRAGGAMANRLVLTLEEPVPGLPGELEIAAGRVLSFGRGPENDLRLEHRVLGRRQARFDFSGDRCTIAEAPDISPGAASIYVNDELLTAARPIEHGDRLLLGG